MSRFQLVHETKVPQHIGLMTDSAICKAVSAQTPDAAQETITSLVYANTIATSAAWVGEIANGEKKVRY